uniref:isoleucine--tRNA ligase n=1 Tax=Drosophila melanogaster TaxID=7227 RepID=Q9VUY4_DROME|nr:Isoleucyl-tRNA synthetase, mitochondrial [Drosophila melanogaster]AAF49539.2 Isoleucyl-tRNA synthetase, mitochondrial [Drosophila melanogaster]|eukprot:NP_648837.2 Isoleucyl-tRNA synthetase, mitochondrial [Drosophila melanogaster]
MLRIFYFRVGNRLYSMKAAKKDAKKYTDTINLPKTKFPNRLTAAKREEQERLVLENKIAVSYAYQEQRLAEKGKPTFVLHDGPPYANGQLHMGHAVNKILKDITLRQRVAHGQRVNYIPGWDCHGLPIELKATSTAPGQSAQEIRQKSRAFAWEAIKSQKEEFSSWGILANWQKDNIYMTFQPEFIVNQLEMFYNLYEKGLVYRDLKPVYWSPSSRTALAEAELEYDANHISPSVYVRFALNPSSFDVKDKQIYALVWTTTPWTLPSNQAICYNASLEYVIVRLSDRNQDELYLMASALMADFEANTQLKCEIVQHLSGELLSKLSYNHPIDKEQSNLPFFDASHVQDSKGTGLVHTAPAHGPEDFLVSLTQKIPVKCFVNEEGTYTKEAPDFLRGKSVLDQGNSLVLDRIAEDVVHSSKLEHSYPIDWRTKKPVIIRASEQWFINTEKLKTPAADALEQVEIYPRANAEASKKALLTQLQKRPYWCISRQRAWGVPIPVLYSRESGKVVLNSALIEHLCNLLRKEGSIDFWWVKSVEELVPEHLLRELHHEAKDLVKGTDILDIWFDSGSTWSAVLGKDKIADLYLEGYDQFTGWFQSSLLMSIAARECAPYKALFVHGFTVDEKGYKMSKSLGNVISPKQITKKYGTDALRWWVASHGTQHMSITVSDKLLQQAAENLCKIRGTMRYLKGVIGEKQSGEKLIRTSDKSYLNRYLLSQLVEFESEVEKLYQAYEYNRVVACVQNFIANQVSAVYVHLIKDRLYCGDDHELLAIRQTLTHCYQQLCKSLWPIVPFLVEESWSYYDTTGGAFHEQIVQTNPEWQDTKATEVINAAFDVKRLINQQAGDVNTWHLAVTIKGKERSQLDLLRELHSPLGESVSNSELCEILQVGSVTLLQSHNSDLDIALSKLQISLCPRCRRYGLEDEQKTCQRCSDVMEAKN